ncbi:MAG: hypothetical protein IKD31_05575 [Clostridia bacterium]|nr:hypothetical protein [Clostridia bacterium]
MDSQQLNPTPQTPAVESAPVKENVLAGAVGAFLFALVGGVLWFVLYLVGFFAGISGLVGAVCAVKGYSLFSKKESVKGIVIAIVMVVLVMAVAWYLCLSYDIYVAHQEWFESEEIDFSLSFIESVQAAPYYLADPDVAPAYLLDLGIGLVLCFVGAGSFVSNKIKAAKAASKASEASPEGPKLS